MFRMSHDAVDFFSADFTSAGVIVAGEEYPLGYFAAETLEVSGQLALDIDAAAKEFAAEAQMFFAARDPSSAGIANEAFRRLWHLLRKLPLGWVLTAIAAAAALVSWLIAWNPPYGGNEGFYFRAYMLTSFTVGSFITGGILLYRRKQN